MIATNLLGRLAKLDHHKTWSYEVVGVYVDAGVPVFLLRSLDTDALFHELCVRVQVGTEMVKKEDR